jgi:hypothetical protein
MMILADGDAVAACARTAPVMVPHARPDASRDFESAYEMLQACESVRESWPHERTKRAP